MIACRYFQWLLGDLDAISNVQGPLAEQLCVVELSKSETICGLDWTHKADGLLCADSSGAVTMLGSVTSGKHSHQLPVFEQYTLALVIALISMLLFLLCSRNSQYMTVPYLALYV